MAIIIGSARSDEYGRYTDGKAGDQRQSKVPDYSGEVSLQAYYTHSKGWYVLRPKDPILATKIAERMFTACNNPHLGYDQNGRLGVIKYGIETKTDTEADCSSLVRACVKEASGKDPGDFYTGNEVAALESTGLFEPHFSYTSMTELFDGDILVTKTKGHTVICVSGNPRKVNKPKYKPNSWYLTNGQWWYADSESTWLHDTWAVINHHKYYFNSDGYAVTGWQIIDNKKYFFENTPEHGLECALYVTDADGAQVHGVF
ncbi:MAG: hypothetical protein KBS66_07470 [Eubacterium sp.]|nr:hypothetical protein [Candidatus Colimonas fimequi]